LTTQATPYLFSDKRLDTLFNESDETVPGRVDAISKAHFLNASIDALVEHITSSLAMMPIVPQFDSVTITHHETKLESDYSATRFEVPAIRIELDLPFSGDEQLWRCQPSHPCGKLPQGYIRGSFTGQLHHAFIVVEVPANTDDVALKTKVESALDLVRSYVAWQEADINDWTRRLKTRVWEYVRTRRERLHRQSRLPELLGIPLRRRADAPDVTLLPLQRRLVRLLPQLPTEKFAPEPGISDGDYEHILAVIRHEGRTFECAPGTFWKFEEEELRDILLAHLNGHYQGTATGETFRKAGKTDIRIEDAARSAFVAECKIWHGQKAVGEACDQLLSYLTWRDCKAALILLNKTVASFASVLAAIPSALDSHPLNRTPAQAGALGEWRHRFALRDDPSREVLVHIFAFNIYSKARSSA
jgi:hypothetical protein